MTTNSTRALSDVLDQLEDAAQGDTIRVEDVIDKLGRQSFAALMLVFSLISTSPASAIPGITAIVAALVFALIVQMILGRESLWLPQFVIQKRMSSATVRKGIGWLRKPVAFVEKFLKTRMTFVLHRPIIWIPLVLILGLTMFMPFLEIIPTSGSIASAIIAIFAAGLLTRDGAVVIFSMVLLGALPLAVWQFGFAA